MAYPDPRRQDLLDMAGALLAVHKSLAVVRETLPQDAQNKLMAEMSPILARVEALLSRMNAMAPPSPPRLRRHRGGCLANPIDMPAEKLQAALERMERNQGDLKGDGEPPDNGAMEARVAKLESAMEYVQRDIGEIRKDIREIKDHARTDFRLVFGALIAVALGLAGLMAKGFHWL